MIYYVYNIKKDDCVFSGSFSECNEYINSQGDDSYFLEIRGGH